jgi:hypothetical protein
MRRARVAVSAVLDDLDQLAACAEKEHGAELRIRAAAEDQFDPAAADHRLDGYAVEGLFSMQLGDLFLDLAVGLGDRGAVGEVELHAADIGLVGNGFRAKFQHDGEAEIRGEACRLLGILCHARGSDGDAVGLEEVLRFKLG